MASPFAAVSSRGLRGAGGGRVSYVEAPVEWRGSSQQVCGLWPHAIGVGAPMVGVPIGRHDKSGGAVCCDPISWFETAGFIANPSMFVLAKPALGKSTLIAIMALGLAASGVGLLFPGDLKPDYALISRALGGQVVEVSYGGDVAINLLDPGAMLTAARELELAGYKRAAHKLRAESRGRRLQLLSGTAALARNGVPLEGHHDTILDTALRLLDERDPSRVPVLFDLIRVLQEGPDQLRHAALSETDLEYRAEIRDLHRALSGMTAGVFGETFTRHTTHPIDVDTPAACVDISRLAKSDERFLAAVLLATWAEGFSAIEAHQALAAHGLRRKKKFFVVMDELWRVLRASKGMVDRVDALTRLNRSEGVATAYITHSFKDLDSLADAEDRAKARGIAERCGLVVCGGVAANDLERVNDVFSLSRAEMADVRRFSASGHQRFDHHAGRATHAAGRGKVLLKPGDYPGIPVRVHKPSVLATLHDTDAKWDMA